MTVQADNLDTFTETQLSEVFEDFYQFSCRFVDKTQRDENRPITQCAIDLNGLKLFLDRVRSFRKDPETRDAFMVGRLTLLLDIVENEVEKQADASPEFMMTSIRCFLIMLQMRELEDFNFHQIFERLVALFNFCNNFLRKQDNTDLA